MHTPMQAQADIRQNIRGIVLDAAGEFPLEQAVIQLNTPDGQLLSGEWSDEKGHFEITNVPVGRYQLVVSHIGYQPLSVPYMQVVSAKETNIRAALHTLPVALPTATVQATQVPYSPVNTMASGSVRLLSIDALQRFAGGFGDPARMVQNYAGVAAANDARNDIVVRGNGPAHVGWRLEGVDIPSPNHWATMGTTGGPIGMLNANNLRNSDFYSGAFPAMYGNATGAIFDLHLRNGNAQKHEWLGQVGFNGFELGAEGPIGTGSGASFITNIRYSTLGVFKAIGVNFGTGSAIPVYQDAVFKLNIPTANKGTLSIWGLGGTSKITFANSGTNIYTNSTGRMDATSSTGIVAATYTAFPQAGVTSKITLAVAAQRSGNASFAPDVTQEPVTLVQNYASDQNQNRYTLSWVRGQQYTSALHFKAGLTTEIYQLALADSVRSATQGWYQEVAFSGVTVLQRGFVQWKYHFNEKWALSSGAHASWLTLNNSWTLEPRLGLTYQHKRQQWGLAFGRHSQLQPLPVYFATDLANVTTTTPNRELGFITSNHLVANWTAQLPKKWNLKIETYHQSLGGLAVDTVASSFSMVNAGAAFTFPHKTGLSSTGKGKNMGVELSLEKNFGESSYLCLTTSLFDSQYQASDGVWRNTFYNSNIMTNLLLGKEFSFSPKWLLSFDTRFSFAGGNRFTPIDLEASRAQGTEVRRTDMAFADRYTPYWRWDVKLAVHHNGRRYTQLWALDFVNVTNRQNEFIRTYSPTANAVRTVWQRGFFPNILYRIVF